MALPARLPDHMTEVRRTMDPMLCPKCRLELEPVPGIVGALTCPEGCGEWLPNDDDERSLRAVVCVRPIKPGPVAPIERAAHYWLAPLGLKGPISQVPQSNARTDMSIMNGPPAPGGGGSKSGRRRKKPLKKLRQDLWGTEGGTNSK